MTHSKAPRVGRCLPALLLLSWLAPVAPQALAQTVVTAGYRDFSYGSTAISTPTGEKPESKLWWNDGTWWGSLYSASGNQYRIHEFDAQSQAWRDTGTAIDNRTNSKADVLWDEPSGHLYVVSHVFTTNGKTTSSFEWGRFYRYTYSPATRRYALDAGFPVTITRGKSETLTIAKDSVQRLWVTYVEGGKVKVIWTRGHDLDWSSPVDLPVSPAAVSVSTDDISAVAAFGGVYVGIAWSNQRTGETHFTFRRDADAPEAWQPVERVLPGPGCSGACADDHLNLKADQYGRVFIATKTSLGNSTDPLVLLAVRSSTTPATWTSHTVGLKRDHHTRPIVLLDEENNRVYVFATSGENGGAIYVKSSPLDDISFPPGLGDAFIKSTTDTRINDATSTKQNVNGSTGLLVVAADGIARFYFHGYLGSGAAPSPPAAPTGLSASAVSSARVDLTWTDASTNEDGFSIERATGTGAFSSLATVGGNVTSYSDTSVQASTSYTYRIRARNPSGFSGYSNTATVTTPAVIVTAPAPPSGLTATAVSSTRITLSWTDASSNEEEFRIERAAGGGTFAELVTVPAGATSYADTTAAAATTYSYRVRARNAAGFSAY